MPDTAPVDKDDGWMDAPPIDADTVFLESQSGEEASVDTPQSIPPEPPLAPTVEFPRAEAPPDPVLPRPSFLREGSETNSFWQRPRVRIALAIALLVLLALLAAQFLVKERDRVAAVEPALQPVLNALCAVAGCQVAPLRQIESIVIDSSSFSRVRDDNYHLGFSLKNTALFDVAMPAMELSLTDPQDQPVIRRVILPAEFGARTPSLERSAIWSGSLALTVRTGSDAPRIAGYRLLAFYP